MSLTKVTNSMIAGAVVNILDYGADPTGVADSTTAVQSAIDYVGSLGGGTVKVPYGNFSVSQLTFGTHSFVVLEGETQGYNYGLKQTNSILTCSTGTWGVRIPYGSSFCGLRNLAIIGTSTRASGTFPYAFTNAGVEYGVLIETGATTMQSVTVYGFQYGCTLANAGNSNLFEDCGFFWNTRAGFVCTIGSAAAYALYHPNLTPPSVFAITTVYTMRNCNIRRNGWGMVLRDGSPSMYNVLNEANFFGGILEWVGTHDSGVSGQWHDCYCEGNYPNFNSVLNWVSAAVTGNTILYDDTVLGVNYYIALYDNADTALTMFGYQITTGASAAGTTFGPVNQTFNNMSMSLESGQKAILLSSAYLTKFVGGGAANQNPADAPYAVKLGRIGGYFATGTHFYDWAGTLPTSVVSNGMVVVTDTSVAATDGGLTATKGHYRGLAGLVTQFASDAPATIAGNVPLGLADSSVIAPGGNTYILYDPTLVPGKWLFIKTIAASSGVASSVSNVVPITGGAAGTAILPATAGAWAALQSDGTNWITMARGT